MQEQLTYAQSGVDIEAGYEVVRRIKPLAASTHRREVLGSIGTFGSLFALDRQGFREPVLVSGTDGVGTKLKIAFKMDRHDTIGIDAVAYCVNDIICQGAEPLFFLDYLAFGKVSPEKVEKVVSGIASGCRQAGCALVGGETAEMPGMYQEGEYDLAGFAVGVAEQSQIIDGARVRAGDTIIGIASSGLQSSGFSLVRKICFDIKRYTTEQYVNELGQTLGEELLTPTLVYAKPILALLASTTVHGIANISGGGLPENLPRAMGPELDAVIDVTSWQPQPIFDFLQQEGDLTDREMFKTFNMGIGMAVIVPSEVAQSAIGILSNLGFSCCIIGEVTLGSGQVKLRGRNLSC